MNTKVTDFINSAPPDQKKIMETLRRLIHDTVDGAEEEFKWGRPVFKRNKDFAYLKSAKNHVTLGFFDAGKLPDPQKRLEGTGAAMKHLKLRTMDDIDPGLLTRWFLAAIE